MELDLVKINPPEGCNLVLGQSHFIKTVEDLHEVMTETSSNVKFGIAFCESSGPCLIRKTGNEEELIDKAVEFASKIGAGHSFLILVRDAYPINFLNKVKNTSEVCRIYCSTANPLQIVIAETDQGRGILGVIDGKSPKGVETEEDIEKRKKLLRELDYKI